MDSAYFLSLLRMMSEEMESVAKDAATVYEEAVKIRKRSEEVEALVDECLALMEK
ncbi:MAG: hypothetical protein J6S14_02375 [Clostridia bacterium]|nr:hypothetical protein [Clostridia bacterium]